MLFIKNSMQNLYLEHINKIFTKNHNFNALRKFDIFFQTESTFERNGKKNTSKNKKKAGQDGVFIYMCLFTSGFHQFMIL